MSSVAHRPLPLLVDDFEIDIFAKPLQSVRKDGGFVEQLALIELRLDFEEGVELPIEIVHHVDSTDGRSPRQLGNASQLVRNGLPIPVEPRSRRLPIPPRVRACSGHAAPGSWR